MGHDLLSPMVAPVTEYYHHLIKLRKLALSDSENPVELPVGEAQQAIGKHRGKDLNGFQLIAFPACRIDTLVQRENLKQVNLIKLDLEGSEEYVMGGMMETIKTFRPRIALSIYHRPEHLYDLPYQLMINLENYTYYMDIYSFERWEVILYAIPKETLISFDMLGEE